MNRPVVQYRALQALRWSVSIALLIIPLAFLLYFALVGEIIRSELVQGTVVMRVIDAIVVPTLEVSERVIAIRPMVGKFNLLLLGLSALAFAGRQMVIYPFHKLELWARSRLPKATQATASTTLAAQSVGTKDRMSMLREYSATKAALFRDARKMSFVSIDVVGSTKMKLNEDKLAIEHAFAEYRKFVERILQKRNCWKVAWTPDGIMCAFHNGSDAAGAAQDLLSQLPWFNDGTHHLKTKFEVRCGMNTGEVVFPDDKAMEEISDRVIDIAGHMQKYASVGTLWIGKPALDDLGASEGFEAVEKEVDGLGVYEWKPDHAQHDTTPSGAASVPQGVAQR